jgi:TRAP-type uncharacterized transport system substrate-binding protein
MKYMIRVAVVSLLISNAAQSQDLSGAGDLQGLRNAPAPNAQIREAWKSRINENAVTIISGNPNGGYLGIAYDIAAVVDQNDDLRVLPIVGKGAVQNLKDVLFLRGVDMGIVNTVTLSYFKKTRELGTNLNAQISYIAMLFQDELHVLARPEINSLYDLEGKGVNFSDKGSGAQLSSQQIFSALKINATEHNVGQGDAIEMMKRGELAATMCTCLKPLKPHQAVPADLGFKLINVPHEPVFYDDYVPARITHEDYPNLVSQGGAINTIAVPTVLVAYSWPREHERYRRLEKFIKAFFSKFPEFAKPPRHPRWKTVNLAASLPNWKRFPAAQEWLDAHAILPKEAEASQKMKEAFEQFLTKHAGAADLKLLPADKRESLFHQFTVWWAAQQETLPTASQVSIGDKQKGQ